MGRAVFPPLQNCARTRALPARALHSSPNSLPVLNESDQTILELKPVSKGLSVVKPVEQEQITTEKG
jgi:hypothetical protein